MKQSSVIVLSIVSHNQAILVRELVESLERFLYLDSKIDLKILVRHNIHSVDSIESKIFEVYNLTNDKPLGFGRNHNLNFQVFESDWFIIVNPDIKFFLEFNLKEILNLKEQNIYSPIIYDQHGKIIDYKRKDISIRNLLKRKFHFGTETGKDWFSGAFLIIKSSHFKRIGGFDERFFMYVEDCDLCIRNYRYGGECEEILNFQVIHETQRESRKNMRFLRIHISSLFYYWTKTLCYKLLGLDLGIYAKLELD